jgi:Tfp pilus assembly protein PilV
MKSTALPSMRAALSRRRVEAQSASERGFTLVELLITMVILPFVVGALALAIVAVFQLNGSTLNRINDAADAQILSTSYENDIHSANQVTLEPTVQCGTASVSGTQLVGLEWDATPAGGYATVVSYVLQTTASATSDQLVREYCTNGNTATPTSSTVVAADITPWTPAMALPPTNPIVPDPATASLTNTSGTNAACSGDTGSSFATKWIDATCVGGVNFSASEPASAFTYSLVAVPFASASSGKSVTPTSSSDCGFATPGSGTYASSLCFVDFSALIPSEADSTNGAATYNPVGSNCTRGGQYLTAAIDYTPFAMSFCLLISPGSYSSGTYDGLANQGLSQVCPYPDPPYGSVCPAWLPTYYSPPASEAYLGNNGFYTGVPGRPGLYTTQSPSTVNLNFYNINVKDANGQTATGWELATGDAESTDSSEDIIWSTCSTLPAVSTTNSYAFQSCTGTPFTLLPDKPGGTQAADIGNACPYSSGTVTGTLFTSTWLTGLGTFSGTGNGAGTISGGGNTVECAANNSSDKTGTVMLEASEPSTLSVQMTGTGLQAIFVGLVLQ